MSETLKECCDRVLISGLSPELRQSIDHAWRQGATKHGIMKAVRRGAGGRAPLLVEAVKAYLETLR